MIQKNSNNTFIKTLISKSETYQSYKQTINNNLLADLQELGQKIYAYIATTENQHRLLRIGIIGQIKRGKSSFLNSLLFNGQDILPKAATPMTAALTRISYAKQPQATVEFYTQQEWQKVADTARQVAEVEARYQDELSRYQQHTNSPDARRRQRLPMPSRASDEQKACCELVRMVESSGIALDDYLGQEHHIEGVSDNTELVGKLAQFVGADGLYTPIVKSTELKLNVPGLEGIEVVDTPGMNDPIISRGRRTQEFIGQCDVVFFLSYCSQFMDMHDMGLLAQNIPNKGIKDIVLIGSVFDSALLDEGHKYAGSLKKALPAITSKLADSARQNVAAVCQQGQDHDHENYVFEALKGALPPIFISSRCYDLANKGEQLGEEEHHSLNSLEKMFPEMAFTPDLLKGMANFGPVHRKLDEVRSKKEAILAGRLDEVMKGAKRELRRILRDIQADITQRKTLLEEGDIDNAAARQQAIARRLERGEKRVHNTFEKQASVAQNQMREALNGLKVLAQSARRVETQSGTTEEAYEVSHTVSSSSWYKPWTWGSTRTIYETRYRTVQYSYANVQDAVDKLESFIYETDSQLNRAVMDAVNIKQLQQDIKEVIRDMFDFSDDNFDPQAVMLPLENALARLTLPEINLDLEKHIDTIRQQFTASEVRDDDIGRLRQEQARVMQLLINEVSREVDISVSGILNTLTTEKQAFLPELTQDLYSQVKQLREDLKEKEEKLQSYTGILKQLEEDLNELAA